MRACARCGAAVRILAARRQAPALEPPRTRCCAYMRCSCSCRTRRATCSCSARYCAPRCPEPLWRLPRGGRARMGCRDRRQPERAAAHPDADEVDLRTLESSAHRAARAPSADRSMRRAATTGRVAGSSTTHGAALVANDMHLGFRVPNIWYRARLIDASADGFDAVGVTLPGTPVDRRRQQRPHRLGIHEQLWRILEGGSTRARRPATPTRTRPRRESRRLRYRR